MPDNSPEDVRSVDQDRQARDQTQTQTSGDTTTTNDASNGASKGDRRQKALELHRIVRQDKLQPQPSGESSWTSRCDSLQLPAECLQPPVSQQQVAHKLAEPDGWQQQMLEQIQELQCTVQLLLQRQGTAQPRNDESWPSSSPPPPAPPQQQHPSEQQAPDQLQPPQPDPGFNRGASTSSTTRQQPPDDRRLLDKLTEDGKPDVYAFTVRAIIDDRHGWRAWKPLLAMLFTFCLQMGLLILLLDGLVLGSNTLGGDSDTDKLWRQVGQVQRQVGWLNQHAVIKESVEAGSSFELAWPLTILRMDTTFEDFQRCQEVFQEGRSGTDKEQAKCEAKVADLDSSVHAFGEGLLFPAVDSSGDETWNLSDGGWVGNNSGRPLSSYQGYSRPGTGGTDRDPAYVNLLAFLALVIYVHEEMRKAVMLAYVAAAHCGILPGFYQTDVSRAATDCSRSSLLWKAVMLLAPLLQALTALMVLVSSLALSFTRETQASTVSIILSNVALSFIVDLDNRMGAMLASQRGVAELAGGGPSQSTAELLGAACGGVLRACHLDRVVSYAAGLIIKACGHAREACQLSRGRMDSIIKACGHAYMAVIGGLLLVEPVLLSPLLVWELYSSIGQHLNKNSSLAFHDTHSDNGSRLMLG